MNSSRIVFLIFVAFLLSSCSTQTSGDQKMAVSESGDLQVYYFHFTKRCATCNAIENETKVVLEIIYADQVQDGNIAFISLNLDEEEGKKMAEELEVSGQTLLLVKGDEIVNLTNEGFMNARTNPGHFHDILKNNIDKML